MRRLTKLTKILLCLTLASCHSNRVLLPGTPEPKESPAKKSAPRSPAPALNDESAVGNGGGVLTSLLHETIKHSLMGTLERPENSGILSAAELSTLKAYLSGHEVLIQLVDPIEAAYRYTKDPQGKQSVTKNGKLHHRARAVNQRVVFDPDLGRWVIQFDKTAWNDTIDLSGGAPLVPPEVYSDLLEVVLLYHHVLKVIDRSGEGAGMLSVGSSPEKKKDARAIKRKAMLVAGATFVGEVSCLGASILFDVVSPETRAASERCNVTASFGADTVTVYLRKKEIIDEEFASMLSYAYAQDHVTVTLKDRALTRDISLWGYGNDDVLELSPDDRLYRQSPEAPPFKNKEFKSLMFCDVAEQGGLLRPAPWRPRDIVPLTSKDKCDVTLKLAEDLTFEVKVGNRKGEIKTYLGTYEQIGFNLLLKYSDGSKGYAWLCRHCKNHFYLPSGEALWAADEEKTEDQEASSVGGRYNVTNEPIKCGRILRPYTSDEGICELTIEVFNFTEEERRANTTDGTAVFKIRRLTPTPEKQPRWFLADYWEAGFTVHFRLLTQKEELSFKNTGVGLANPDFYLIAEGEKDDEL